MSDKVTDWLRTAVPALWAAVVTWLIALGAPEWLTDPLNEHGGSVALPVVLWAVYGLLKASESRMPDWLHTVLMGSKHEPEFPSKPPTHLPQHLAE